MESSSYVFSFRVVFFCLVTTSWIFDMKLVPAILFKIHQYSSSFSLCPNVFTSCSREKYSYITAMLKDVTFYVCMYLLVLN